MDIPATLRHLRVMQDCGLSWMSRVKTRSAVCAHLEPHLRAMGVSLAALPPIVHIAGTKGKGSTSAMVESCLRSAGLRTGLFTSPHLVCPTERIAINGRPISRAAYLAEFSEGLARLQAAHGTTTPADLTGFTFLLLLAYRQFLAARLDVLVLEVSVGGLLCATNAFPASQVLASGVTLLDYDHTALLGSTLEAIAGQKAGIFRPGVPACAARPAAPSVASVLRSTAQAAGAPLWWACPEALAAANGGALPHLSLPGRFQAGNAAMAASLVHLAMQRLGGGAGAAQLLQQLPAGGQEHPPQPYPLPSPLPQHTLKGLASTAWPGRAQVVPVGAATLHLDGAHTPASMAEVCLWFRGCLAAQAAAAATASGGAGGAAPSPPPPVLVFYCGRDKLPFALLEVLAAGVQWGQVHIVALASGSGEAAASEAAWGEGLRHTWQEVCSAGRREAHVPEGAQSWQEWLGREEAQAQQQQQQGGVTITKQPEAVLHASFAQALQHIQAGAVAQGTPVLVTGSLYLVGEALAAVEAQQLPQQQV